MEKQLRALILEDSQADTLLLVRELKRVGYDVEYTRVETEESMSRALENSVWDIILSDYSMPQFSATAGLALIKDMDLDIPFIIVSGTMGEEAAVLAMKSGAHDYFPKGRTARLGAAIEREIRERQEREQRRQTETKLRQAEERFAKAFQVSPIGITISSSQGYFLSVNDSFRQMLGYHFGEIVGRTSLEIDIWVNPNDQNLLINSPAVQDAETTLRTRLDNIRYVSVSTEHIDVSGEPCVLAMWQDITARKLAEQTIKKNNELTHLLQTVTVAANETTDVNAILQFALDHICDYAGWPIGHIFLRSRGGTPKLASSKIWHFSDPTAFDSFRQTSEKIEFNNATGGLIYRVFDRAQPEWLNNLNSGVGFIRWTEAQKARLGAVYAFPILAQTEVVAVMEFLAFSEREEDRLLLNTIPQIAVQIGHVIERTHASEEIRALSNATGYLFNAESLQDLAQQIVQGVIAEFEQVDCGLFLLGPQMGHLDRVTRAGEYQVEVHTTLSIDDRGLVPEAIRTGLIVYSPDVHLDSRYVANVPSTQSELVIPLKARTGTLGALDLQSPEQNYFSQRDQRILSAFAERAAAALEITRLYEEINLYASELESRVEERTLELQKAKERVEAILNNSSDAIILVNVDGKIQQTNPRFIELFGYEYDELFGHDLSQAITTETGENIFQDMLATVSSQKYGRYEVTARRKNGTTFPADAAFAIFKRNSESEFVCSLRDISQQKRLELELREAFEQQKELADLKSRFISTVSHEYRTPLAVIQTSAGLLQQYSDRLPQDKKDQHLEKIIENVRRLTGLLNNVIAVNRTDALKGDFNPEQMDLVEMCQEMIDDTHQVNPLYQVDLSVIGPVRPILADKELIRQIISNLLSNAIKYSPEMEPIEVQLQFQSVQVQLLVRDGGIGIPPDDLENLFALFHRARNVGLIQGTGLGLAIVKQAVDSHEGTISVNSVIGKGTTFIVTLPA